MNAARLLILGCLLLALCGCGVESKQDFAERIRSSCARSESRVSPKTMELSALRSICGREPDVTAVDEQTQRWQFRFPDGLVELPVLTDSGHTWQQENPRVYVAVSRITVN